VQTLIASDRADAAPLFAGTPPSSALVSALRDHDWAFAYTRTLALSEGLATFVPRVVTHDPDPPAAAGHASQWLARPLQSLGLSAEGTPPSCRPGPKESLTSDELLSRLPQRFLAVHPGSGSVTKNWPAQRFAALIDALAPGEAWLLVEGPADEASAAPLRGLPRAVLARDRPLRSLGALLGHAGLYVGNDSGVTHLAAAWGAPTLALFGPTDPTIWGPVGERVTSIRSRNERMDGLDLSQAVAAALALKAPGASPGRGRRERPL
jgi:ADP-heptose:LPS heptosyltransferase